MGKEIVVLPSIYTVNKIPFNWLLVYDTITLRVKSPHWLACSRISIHEDFQVPALQLSPIWVLTKTSLDVKTVH